jgi:HD superfamily phosphodiesterase
MTYHYLQETIHSHEKSIKHDIETFFLQIYPSDHLISHGLEHHRRVWEYAKDLILNTQMMKEAGDIMFILNALIACYFHDIGMAADHGAKHGSLGKKRCIDFLSMHNLNISGFRIALEAIEYHDDKEYSFHPPENKVLEILSVADDLDAFGATGIYRYAEIYLKRGITFGDVGFMISKNAFSRFENLEKRLWLSEEFKNRHRERYNYLNDFFREYNSQVSSYNFNSANPSGPCGIIQIISRADAINFSNILKNYSTNKFIIDFLNQLNTENEIIRTS